MEGRICRRGVTWVDCCSRRLKICHGTCTLWECVTCRGARTRYSYVLLTAWSFSVKPTTRSVDASRLLRLSSSGSVNHITFVSVEILCACRRSDVFSTSNVPSRVRLSHLLFVGLWQERRINDDLRHSHLNRFNWEAVNNLLWSVVSRETRRLLLNLLEAKHLGDIRVICFCHRSNCGVGWNPQETLPHRWGVNKSILLRKLRDDLSYCLLRREGRDCYNLLRCSVFVAFSRSLVVKGDAVFVNQGDSSSNWTVSSSQRTACTPLLR